MELAGLVFSGKLLKWLKKHFTIFAINLSSSIGVAYLWNKENKYIVPAFSLLGFGASYLYCRIYSRDEISSNQAIIITGCDSGLGYSLALHCREIGATVIAGVLQSNGPGATTLRKNDILVYHLDITKKESVVDFKNSALTAMAVKNLVLRCVINNSGAMVFGEFEWQTEDQIRSQVEVNILGTMRITRELMPAIRAYSSRIIMVSSHCTTEPLPGVAVYGATKAAIGAWSTAIRVELKKYGVKVVCFVPGSFTKESNILSRQIEYFDEMRESMSEEARNFYGDYFTRYAQYFTSIVQEIAPRKLQNPRIYRIFEGALLDRYPSAIYKCEPWRYFFYHTLFKTTPYRVRDTLAQRFVQMPAWRIAKNVDVAATEEACTSSRWKILPAAIHPGNFASKANERNTGDNRAIRIHEGSNSGVRNGSN